MSENRCTTDGRMTTAEAAAALGVSLGYAQRLAREGKLGAVGCLAEAAFAASGCSTDTRSRRSPPTAAAS